MQKKLVKSDDIPAPLKTERQKWLKIFKQIPTGQALHLTEEEAGYKASSIKGMVWTLKKRKLLADSYRVRQYTDDKKVVHIYIENAKA